MNNFTEESTHSWSELHDDFKQHIIRAHAKILKTRKTATLMRLYNIANPEIIVGVENDQPCCRLEEKSLPALKVLLIKNNI